MRLKVRIVKSLSVNRPTAPTPYMCILDEYGYYAVQGFAVVPAQARSLVSRLFLPVKICRRFKKHLKKKQPLSVLIPTLKFV